jgi:hypothetical protein
MASSFFSSPNMATWAFFFKKILWTSCHPIFFWWPSGVNSPQKENHVYNIMGEVFLFSNLCGRWFGHHPQEDLTKFQLHFREEIRKN